MSIYFNVFSTSPQQTDLWGYELGRLLQAGDVIGLVGDLGAGKTTLVRGLGRGWGVQEPLTSPTFVIVHQHHRPQDAQILHHIDAYRLTTPADADSLGLEDIFSAEGVVLIEWADQIQNLLPTSYLWLTLDYAEDDLTRSLTAIAHGERAETLLALWQEVIHAPRH